MNIKRYWKLISILAVIVVVLTTYFIQSSLAASRYPNFVLKTISGDKSEVENITMYGEYYQLDSTSSGYLRLTSEGTEYLQEQSYFERLNNKFEPSEITRLQDEYRNFMRSKPDLPALYFEDDNVVAYANLESEERWGTIYPEDYYFDIAVFDKKTNDTSSFEIEIPGQKDYWYMNVYDVQVVDGMLKVVTDVFHQDGETEEHTLSVYTFDIATQKLVGDETVLTGIGEESEGVMKRTSFTLLNDADFIGIQTNLFLMKEESTETIIQSKENESTDVDTEVIEDQVTNRQVYVYNLATNEMTELALSDEIKTQIENTPFNSTAFIDEEYAYFNLRTEENLTVVGYNIETLTEEMKQTFDLANLGITNPTIRIKNNNVYLVESQLEDENSVEVIVGDLLTGDILYEGEIVIENPTKEQKNYGLQLYEIEIK
ncbi:hypothetical protein [Ornithinibacillus xuwenensis]|uniref:Uncharacterized protein n=1 Tax=Ornithinibacillus xuwenensis TaxID=3144668 RepID=A0ABU9XKL4_9BACI